MDFYTFVFFSKLVAFSFSAKRHFFTSKMWVNCVNTPITQYSLPFCFLLFEQTLPRFTKQNQNSYKTNKPISVYLGTLYVIFFLFFYCYHLEVVTKNLCFEH